MRLQKQSGYVDMQIMPAMIGVVWLYMMMAQLDRPDFDLERNLIKFCILLCLGTALVLYGFVMHLYALGYPESPFSKHSSPALMVPLCAAPFAYIAYRFFSLDMLIGSVLYAVLCFAVIAAGIRFALRRNRGA